MPAYDASIFNVDPYYDDYSDSKGFLRTLYRPGYAVQARELTQMQTVAQTQLQRFGDNIFVDGSIVTESQVALNGVKYLRVGGLSGYSGVSIGDFAGLTAAVSGKNTIKVLDTLGSLTGSSLDTYSVIVFDDYLNGATGFAVGDVVSANLNGTTIYASVTGGTGFDVYGGATPPYSGTASLVGLDQGVRYIKGYFVLHSKQKITPYNITGTAPNTYRVFNNLDSTVYLNVTDRIVTATDDATLNDPAIGSYNYQAPGADRYAIDLTLSQQALSITANYTLINIAAGQATFKSNYPEYNILADTLARRTYDQSGNFTVDDFPISVEDITGNDSQLNIRIGKGKAYIFGQEFINYTTKTLVVNKARTTKTLTNQTTPIVVGSQVNLRFNPGLTATNVISSIDFNAQPRFFISSVTGTSSLSGSNIGYLRLGNVDPFSSPIAGSIYDVTMNAGLGLTYGRRLFHSSFTGANQHVFEFTDTPLSVYNANYSALVFPLSNDINSYAVTGDIGSFQLYFEKSATANFAAGVNVLNVDTTFGLPNISGLCEFLDPNLVKAYGTTGVAISATSAFGANNRTINFTPSVTGIATIWAKFNLVGANGGGAGFRRGKVSNTKTATLSMRNNGFEDFAYLNGAVDVYRIISITGQFGAGGQTSLTSYFTLDDGQKDTIYDWSRIVVKPDFIGSGITAVSATYLQFDRYTSSPNGPYNDGPFVPLSYSNVDMKEIPVYSFKERSGKPFSLAGSIDFRPDRITPASFTGSDTPQIYGTTGSKAFVLDNAIENLGWTYYLPRTDKIVLGKDKTFRIISGSETDQSPAPPDTADAMSLGSVFYYPFTKSSLDTVKSFVKNRRYTMKDIGDIDKRVDRLEYYTTLSLGEKDAKSLEIIDPSTGLNKYKNGIFVDSTSSRANIDYFNPENLCSVDPARKEIRPRFSTQYIDYSINSSTNVTTSTDGIITLPYTTTIFVNQQFASKAVNVNPFNVSNFNGTLGLAPSSDDWVDVTTRPDVVVNLQGENDGIADNFTVDFGTVWNNWETNWTGRLVGLTPWQVQSASAKHSVRDPITGRLMQRAVFERVALQQQNQTRTGTDIQIQSETVSRNIGERVVDVSIIPFMRAVSITANATGMRPNVTVYPFFDGVGITAYTAFNGVTAANIVTDAEGKATVRVSIPAGVFKTGDRILRLIDDAGNAIANCTTTAEQVFRSQGIMKTEEATIVSTRNINIRRESVTEDRIFNNITTQQVVRYVDPIAQTFLIDPLTYPNGLFLASVDLFFRTKSASLPVNIQIRPVINGYPSSSTTVPFSEVYASPASVNVSEDATSVTNFAFSSPLYLQPGEYAIAVLTNSDEYTVWTSEVGQNDITSGERITSQPYAGSFFKSQNSSTWTAEQTLDMKFKLYQCLFSPTSGSVVFAYTETAGNITNALNGVNVYRQNATYLTPPGTSVSNTSTNINGTVVVAQNNQNYTLPTKVNIAAGNSFTSTMALSTTDANVSPVLDRDRFSGLYIFNIFNTVSSSFKDQYESLNTVRGIGITSANVSSCRYITKKINLQQGFESNSIDVYMNARMPFNSDLRVYMRSQSPTDNTDFTLIPYEPLTIHPNYAVTYGSATGSSRYISATDDDFVELRFTRGGTGVAKTSGLTGYTQFKNFQLKVVMYGDTSNSVVPAFKDMKGIAT